MNNKKINKGADSSVMFLGFQGVFLYILAGLLGFCATLWFVLNAISSINLFIKNVIPLGLGTAGVTLLRYVANNLGASGVDKFLIKNKKTKIYIDNPNPFKHL